MNITLRYTGQLAAAAGTSETAVELDPGVPLAQVLLMQAQAGGDDLAELLLDPEGAPRSTLLVAVDGVHVRNLGQPVGPEVREIVVMTPIAGG